MINKCPFCNKSMPYSEIPIYGTIGNNSSLTSVSVTAESRSCTSVYHCVIIVSNIINLDSIGTIKLLVDPLKKMWAIWNFYENSFRIEFVDKKSIVQLPFFEPDFSLGYQKLANKIKTYITFS